METSNGNNKIENPRAYLEGREEEFHGPRSRKPSIAETGMRKQKTTII